MDALTNRVPPPSAVRTPVSSEAGTAIVPSFNESPTAVVQPVTWATPAPVSLSQTRSFDPPSGPGGNAGNGYAAPPPPPGPVNGFAGRAAGPAQGYPPGYSPGNGATKRPAAAPWEHEPDPAGAGAASDPHPADAEGNPGRGVLLGVLVALAAVAAVAPYGATWIAALGMVAARVIDRSNTALLVRRDQRGRRGSDPVMTVLALPWRLVLAGLTTVLWLILPILIGISVAFISASIVAGAPTKAIPGTPGPLAAGMVALLLTAWWGPGGGPVRRGSQRAVRFVCPSRRAQITVWVVLALVLISAVIVTQSATGPDWGPLERSNLVQLLSLNQA
jgi:hypothetical protein